MRRAKLEPRLLEHDRKIEVNLFDVSYIKGGDATPVKRARESCVVEIVGSGETPNKRKERKKARGP